MANKQKMYFDYKIQGEFTVEIETDDWHVAKLDMQKILQSNPKMQARHTREGILLLSTPDPWDCPQLDAKRIIWKRLFWTIKCVLGFGTVAGGTARPGSKAGWPSTPASIPTITPKRKGATASTPSTSYSTTATSAAKNFTCEP